jgi:hypothetical protein
MSKREKVENGSSNGRNAWLSLPPESSVLCLTYLDPVANINVTLTSRALRQAAEDNICWSRLCYRLWHDKEPYVPRGVEPPRQTPAPAYIDNLKEQFPDPRACKQFFELSLEVGRDLTLSDELLCGEGPSGPLRFAYGPICLLADCINSWHPHYPPLLLFLWF